MNPLLLLPPLYLGGCHEFHTAMAGVLTNRRSVVPARFSVLRS
nr:MAG TPA: hypothetical protein [Caudoviricetes sp.]